MTRKVLVADDDRLIVATLANGLRLRGFEIVEATSGREALEAGRNAKPDLAVLDIRMPDISGIEVGKAMMDELRLPVLFLSAYSDAETIQAATMSGSVGYLVKPVSVQQLIPAVEMAIKLNSEFRNLKDRESHLEKAVNQDRTISVAIGLIMERHRLSQAAAFELMRKKARAQRRSMSEIAKVIVNAVDEFNALLEVGGKS